LGASSELAALATRTGSRKGNPMNKTLIAAWALAPQSPSMARLAPRTRSRSTLAALALPALAALLLACEETPPPVAPPPPPPPPAETAAVVTPPPPAEPTPEEKKKAEEEQKKAKAAAQLAADRAEWETESKADAARWTPELHASAKKLADAKYPTLKAALTAALKSAHRKPASAPRDAYRHPLETLEFFGLKPTMTVLEIGPGEGWYTELLAPTLAAKGKLLVTTPSPDGPLEVRGTFYGQRIKRFLDTAPEVYGKVERVVTTGPLKLDMDGKLDMVILARGLHGAARDGQADALLGEVFRALKPGGVLGVEQHRAAPGANAADTAKKGYLSEAYVIEVAEKAGFKLAGKSEVNANPKDTKDYAEGVWTLPPSLELKDKDRQKYLDIGESDRMTLRFVKPKAAPKKK
jgi:predicted methyltransferase